MAAQISRGKIELTTSNAIASLANTLSKFAMDICLYMGKEYDFISFPNDLTTGSSIMPHKKNPDIFELIRGKCNILKSLPTQITMLTANLPSGYHREMQLAKGPIIDAVIEIKECLKIFTESLKFIKIKKNILEDPKYKNKELPKFKEIEKKYGTFKSYLEQCTIKCKAEEKSEIYISAEGFTFPCCWLAGQPFKWWKDEKKGDVHNMIGDYDKINLKKVRNLF